MHDPARYAIYDSRVAINLNGLIAADGSEHCLFFPMPPSKGTATFDFKKKLMKSRRHKKIETLSTHVFYLLYIGVLKEVARKCKSKIVEVEMCLFTYSSELSDLD